MRKKYKLTPTGTECMEEKDPLQYRMCRDGICIYGGSLLGSGFIDFSQGITLPCEIDGIPVTEINYATGLREVEYIEAWSVKRINLRLYVADCYLCTPPRLYGGIKDTIESLSLIYDAPIVRYGSFRNRKDITDITFTGTVTEQPDWDCGYFEPAAFRGCCNLHSVSGYFKGRILSEKTFEDCIALRRIPVLDVKIIGRRAFYNCISLKNVKFGVGLEIISQEALSHCSQLEDVYIPDTVCCIEESVFADCVSLNNIY